MRSTKEAELNLAVLTYAAKCLAEGDCEALERLGLKRADVEAIEALGLTDTQYVAAIGWPILRTDALDRDLLARLVAHVKRMRSREDLRNALLQHDAPQPLMYTLFGTDTREYAWLRKRFDAPSSPGRSREPTEAEEHTVWSAYEALGKQDHEALSADDYLTLRQQSGVSLRLIWLLIQRWQLDGAEDVIAHRQCRAPAHPDREWIIK